MYTNRDYTQYILKQIELINPHSNKDNKYAYATGFLASLLAEFIRNDSKLHTQFKLAIASKYANQRKT